MKNQVYERGTKLPYANEGAAIASGDVVVAGELVGIAVSDIPADGSGIVDLEGVYELKKEAALEIAQGDKLYWDSVAKEITKDPSDKAIGHAFKAAAGADTVVEVQLGSVPAIGQAEAVAFEAGANLVGVDGTGNNAAPLAGTETRLDALDAAVAGIITKLQEAGIMASE